MKTLKAYALAFGATISGLSAGATYAEPVALSGEEVSAVTDLLNTIDDWKDLSMQRVSVSWAGAIENGSGTRVQLTRCGYTGCQPWKDLYIKRDHRPLIADHPVEFSTSVESASPISFQPRRVEFIDTLNVLFQNPKALEQSSKIGNTVFTAVYERRGEDQYKYTFVLGLTGPWRSNMESGGLIVLQGKSQNIDFWTFGKTYEQ